jgi:hypothetical protein
LSARNGLTHRSKTASLFDHFVGAQEEDFRNLMMINVADKQLSAANSGGLLILL